MRKVQNPRPNWKVGDGAQVPTNASNSLRHISLDPKIMTTGNIYRFLIHSIVPRPIGFVSTFSPSQNKGNLAPYSFFQAIGSNPAALMISVCSNDKGGIKDTLLNIEETGQFVVNIVSEWVTEAMNHCSAAYPHGVDEMEKVGLTALDSDCVLPKRVKECAVHFECQVCGDPVQVGERGAPGAVTVVIGEIKKFHVFQEMFDSNKYSIDITKLKPVARIGGIGYSPVTTIFDLPRAKIGV